MVEEDTSERAPRAFSEAEGKPKRRSVSVPVKIKEIKPELGRICVAGTIVSKNSELYSFQLDDGNGSVLVLTNDADKFNELREGQFVRVFGKIWGEGDEVEIQGEIVQDFDKIDKELYLKLI